MREIDRAALEHCELGLRHLWRGEVDAAITAYDRGAVLAGTDEVRELIVIRKAEALITAGRDGAEVRTLPAVVLRRRAPQNVYLAAYALMRKFSEEPDDRKRALNYGDVARTAADELGEPLARVNARNGLGVLHVIESQFRVAIEEFEEALAIIDETVGTNERLTAMRAIVIGNLGGAKVLSGSITDGIRMLEAVLPLMDEDYLVAEVCFDLSFGYVENGDYATAERHARRALEAAVIPRQVRNANHMLGEICVRTQRFAEAETHFDVVAGFYPDFKNVKHLLIAVDLFSVVNWKA